MRKGHAIKAALAATLLASGVAAAAVVETFTGGANGWDVVDLTGSGNYTSQQGSAYAVAHRAAGGNPGGYIDFLDPSNYSFYFNAPLAFRGDLSGYRGGKLTFDTFYTPHNGSEWRGDADVLIYGASSILVWQAAQNPGAAWTPVSTILDVGQGWRVGSLAGALATAADFDSVLGSVGALRIRGEYYNGVTETTGLDNVALSEAPPPSNRVPEPASLALMFGGLGLLVVARRLRRVA